MNTALILAGGTDARFGMDVPKQFVNVNNRPLIVYTMEAFQQHQEIDEIIVICLNGWQEMVRVYARQFNIGKLTKILAGGKNAQESTYIGLEYLSEKMKKGDIVVIHDAIRPMITQSIITNLGEKVFFSEGSDLNLKINTTEDVEMFKALYKMYRTEETDSTDRRG